MALTNFVSKITTISADWLNKIDTLFVTVFGEAQTKVAARTALDVYSKAETGALVDDLSGVTDAYTATSNIQTDFVVDDAAALRALTLSVGDSGKSVRVISDDGGIFIAKTGAAPGTYTDNGGVYCGTQVIPTGGDGSAGWVRPAGTQLSIVQFGAVGDGVTDDAVPISNAFAWLEGDDYRELIFPHGYAFRIGLTCTVNFGGGRGGSIVMHSPIVPDAGIGNAFEIINGYDTYLKLYVSGGGQTADYTQADPVGGDQAFYIRGLRGSVLDVVGYNYKGRVVRATVENVGEAKTSRLTFNTFRTGDFGAASCGQAIYADASSAFGEFVNANWFWDDYGPVFEDVSDVSFGSLDSGWNNGHGMVLKGVLSFWALSLSLGDESFSTDLLTITDSASRSCGNINIASILLNRAKNGLIIENIDPANDQNGVRVGYVASKFNSERGVIINNCDWVSFDLIESIKDAVTLELMGASNKNIDINMRSLNSGQQSLIIGADSLQIDVRGAIQNANSDASPNIPAVEVNSTGRDIEFHSVSIESGNVDYLYKFVPSNNVVIDGGNVIATGSSNVMGPNLPKVARAVRGFRTSNHGTATILNGTSNIVVTHGLVGTPSNIQVQGRHLEVAANAIDSIGSASFNAVVGAAVTADRQIWWTASLLQDQA